MTTGAKLLAFLVVVVGLLAFLGRWWDTHQVQERERASVADRTAQELRRLRGQLASADSVREVDAGVWALQVRRAASDSLAAWLRARASRPLPRRIDSILVHDTVELAEDSGSSPPEPPVCLSADDARRLLARDSIAVNLGDSLRGVVRLDSARIDSVRTLVVPQRTPWGLLGAAAGAGYVAGLLTCIVTR